MPIKVSQLAELTSVDAGTVFLAVDTAGTLVSKKATALTVANYVLAGNAATATKLATARNINGVAFDGTADISITASIPASTTSVLGGVIVPAVGTSGITNTSGTIGLATATTTQLGGVKIDGTTVTISGSGVISAAPLQATTVHAFALDGNNNLIYTKTTGQSFNYTTDGQNSSYVMVDIGTDVYNYSLDASGNLIATFSS
jgi:hypothetical protein